jgi:hypothetical protein
MEKIMEHFNALMMAVEERHEEEGDMTHILTMMYALGDRIMEADDANAE